MKILFKILAFMLVLISLNSCFEEDDQMEPILISYESEVVVLPYNIYTSNVYFDFSTGSIINYHENDTWDIAFQTGIHDARVIINSSDLLQMANVGPIDFGNYTALSGEEEWNYDASSGVADSSATGIWVDTSLNPKHYSNNLYLLGKENGLSFDVIKKIQFIHVDSTYYTVLYGDLISNEPDTLKIFKDSTYNFTGYSFRNSAIVNFEPPKNEWDIVFRQYLSTLWTDDGIATPYSVRGVILNTNNVEVAKDTNSYFGYFFPNIGQYEFSYQWDIIGWDWKDVTIDETSNSAVYEADPKKIYIIKDTDGYHYKMHFIGFYNQDGVKGYPAFEYVKLN